MILCRIQFEELLSYFEGTSSKSASKTINRHVAEGCKTCISGLAWVREFMPSLHYVVQYKEERVTAAAMARAIALMPTKAQPAIQASFRERLVTAAALLFDTRLNAPSMVAARDLIDGSVHVAYSAGTIDVDIWQESAKGGNWFVTGQALCVGNEVLASPDSVSLVSSVNETITGSLEDSEFSFESVRPGSYELRLQWADQDVVIDSLTIGDVELV